MVTDDLSARTGFSYLSIGASASSGDASASAEVREGHTSGRTPAQDLTLIEADPDRFFRPPYVGPSGWVGVVLDTKDS